MNSINPTMHPQLNRTAAVPTSDQTLNPVLNKVQTAVTAGLQMLSFTQDLNKADLGRVAAALLQPLFASGPKVQAGDVQAFASQLNSLFERRNIEPLLAQARSIKNHS